MILALIIIQKIKPLGAWGAGKGPWGLLLCWRPKEAKPLKQPKKQDKEMDEIRHSNRNRGGVEENLTWKAKS